ncbi:hypothetical protein [Thermus sp.]|uniref:hypothetical protein n=1 Tax=Thermus sp. TaxID=275 RepID=UPI0025CC4238|nr:hypothetical protein [Thermus sp.]MCS6869701.1 hypothetical protein [Thermus sp.]MDW8358466.1 hypothetical protein [Thermus sp.]
MNALTLSLGLLFAHILNRPLVLRSLWRTLFLLPWVVPSYVVGLLWGFTWLKNGIINTLLWTYSTCCPRNSTGSSAP